MATITGTPNNDPLTGTTENDRIDGLAGNDTLYGGTGGDSLYGGDGDDILVPGYVRGDLGDVVNGGNGIDTLIIDFSSANEASGIGYDTGGIFSFIRVSIGEIEQFNLTGTLRDDELRGGIGNDTLNGGDGNDRLISNGGIDTFDGGNGTDFVRIDFSTTNENQNITNIGTSGLTNGTRFTGVEKFDLKTGSGNDLINFSGDYDDIIDTTGGNDTVNAGGGADQVSGSTGNDSVDGGTGNDRVTGDIGDDHLYGGTGGDTLYGGDGDDILTPGYVRGDLGDVVNGGNGFDTLIIDFSPANEASGVGYDTGGIFSFIRVSFGEIEQFNLTGTLRDDFLLGGIGNDTLNGGAGNDSLTSYNGNPQSSGDDQLAGAGGNDSLISGDGSDTLQGGKGRDTLEGGEGQDFFVFNIGGRFNRSIGIDTVVDFQRPDRIVLDKTTFKSIKGRQVSFAVIKSIGQAQTSSALITYIRSTGALYYNQNGEDAGFGQGRQFADLTDGLSLRRSNFVVKA